MIKHDDVPSTQFQPSKDLIMVHPRELPQGEVKEGNFVIEMEQNTSVVDRSSLGVVVAQGIDIKEDYIGKTIIWVTQDGIDMILQDGQFLMLQEKSILGTVGTVGTVSTAKV